MAKLRLSEWLQGLRSEIHAAQFASSPAVRAMIPISLEEFEIEVEVVTERKTVSDGGGEVGVDVLSVVTAKVVANEGQEDSRSHTQTIRMKFKVGNEAGKVQLGSAEPPTQLAPPAPTTPGVVGGDSGVPSSPEDPADEQMRAASAALQQAEG